MLLSCPFGFLLSFFNGGSSQGFVTHSLTQLPPAGWRFQISPELLSPVSTCWTFLFECSISISNATCGERKKTHYSFPKPIALLHLPLCVCLSYSGLLTAVTLLLWGMGSRVPRASVIAACKHSSCETQAELPRGVWDLPIPGIEPMSPALTTGRPGKCLS